MNKRPLDVDRIIYLYTQYKLEYDETGLVGFGHSSIQIEPRSMIDVAPIEEWKTESLKVYQNLTKFTVEKNGIEFIALIDLNEECTCFLPEHHCKVCNSIKADPDIPF